MGWLILHVYDRLFHGQVSEFYPLIENTFHDFAHDYVDYHNYRHQKKNREGRLDKTKQATKRSEGQDKCGANNHYSGKQQILPWKTFEE